MGNSETRVRDPGSSKDQAQVLLQARVGGHGLYSSVVERQSCKLKVRGSIPSEGSFGHPCAVAQARGRRTEAGSPGTRTRAHTRTLLGYTCKRPCSTLLGYICKRPCKHAAIAQLGERQTEDLKVPGSIPGLGIYCFSDVVQWL